MKSQHTWKEWLEAYHTQPDGLWLMIAKKGSGQRSVGYIEAVETALCYGWIDGQKRTYNKLFYLQKFTPRRPKSIWSKINCQRAEVLNAAGRMMPAGIAQVDAAKADGRWEAAYDSPSHNSVPTDFEAALNKNRAAKAFFATLNKTNVYAFCWRIQTAKKPETRSDRIKKFVAMLARDEKLH